MTFANFSHPASANIRWNGNESTLRRYLATQKEKKWLLIATHMHKMCSPTTHTHVLTGQQQCQCSQHKFFVLTAHTCFTAHTFCSHSTHIFHIVVHIISHLTSPFHGTHNTLQHGLLLLTVSKIKY